MLLVCLQVGPLHCWLVFPRIHNYYTHLLIAGHLAYFQSGLTATELATVTCTSLCVTACILFVYLILEFVRVQSYGSLSPGERQP